MHVAGVMTGRKILARANRGRYWRENFFEGLVAEKMYDGASVRPFSALETS